MQLPVSFEYELGTEAYVAHVMSFGGQSPRRKFWADVLHCWQWFAGLIIAGLLAEAMNSLSSGMNAASAVIGTDLVGRFRRRKMEAAQELRLLRWISLLVGTAVVLLSAGVGHVQGNLLELIYKVVNLLTAPLFSLFFMAIFIPWATAFGAVLGAVAGVVVAVLINYWREIAALGNHLFNLQLSTEPLLSFLWGTPLSLVTAALVGMLASLLPIGAPVARPPLS